MSKIEFYYHVRRLIDAPLSLKGAVGKVGKFVDYQYGTHPFVLDFEGTHVAFREDEVEPYHPGLPWPYEPNPDIETKEKLRAEVNG